MPVRPNSLANLKPARRGDVRNPTGRTQKENVMPNFLCVRLYMIVSGETLDEAAEVAREYPGLVSPGSGVEVIEIHTH